MNKLQMLKGFIGFLTGFGVGNIVDDGLKMIQPSKQKGALSKIATSTGKVVLSLFIADKVTAYVDEQWTETEKTIKELIQKKPNEVTEEETN